MQASLNSLLLASLTMAAIVSGAPTASTTKGHFSVTQVKNSKFIKSGAIALAKAYAKHNVALPDNLAAAVKNAKTRQARRDTGSATTTSIEGDSEWITPVEIGTPAQTLYLDFDTGSSDLWVFSSETTSSDVDGQTEYNPSKSSTAKLLSGETWSISYGDGSSSSGNVYDDTVAVGGLTVTSQAVEAAEQVSSEFTEDTEVDGLLGLGFSSINTVTPNQQKTFFDNAKSELTLPLFTADLKSEAAGTYNFGYINASAYTGSITYVDVDNSEGYWGFTSSGYGIGSASFKEESISGIADTGTTLLLLPDSVVKAYYAEVSGASYNEEQAAYVFSCTADIPDFVFGIGSSKVTIPASYMNFEEIESGTCYGSLQSSDDIGINIYGDIALKSAFVVFDGGNNQLGWASKTL